MEGEYSSRRSSYCTLTLLAWNLQVYLEDMSALTGRGRTACCKQFAVKTASAIRREHRACDVDYTLGDTDKRNIDDVAFGKKQMSTCLDNWDTRFGASFATAIAICPDVGQGTQQVLAGMD